jgi:hypothetical protein
VQDGCIFRAFSPCNIPLQRIYNSGPPESRNGRLFSPLAIILSVLFDGNVEDGCVAEVVATRWRMTYMKTLFRRESLSDLQKSKLHSARVSKLEGRIKEL